MRFLAGTLLSLLSLIVLIGCAGMGEREETPEMSRLSPFGALPFGQPQRPSDPAVEQAIRQRLEEKIAANPGSKLPYHILVMSGGGTRGAYGAGVLSGWTLTGERPEFDVVTGVSVGALMATFAFLGPDYDRELQLNAEAASIALSKRRFAIGAIRQGALFEGEGLAELLLESITPELLDAVAVEYRNGRRLFVGTTNLDRRRFIVWDMGMIANSDRPDRVEQYVKVLLASAAVPLYFQPQLFPLDTPSGDNVQMHVDGGVYRNLFVTDYNDTLSDVLADYSLSLDDFDIELFVLVNGQLKTEQAPPPVRAKVLDVAGISVASMMRANTAAGVQKLWLLSLLGGTKFYLSFIPPEVEFHSSLTELDLDEMRELFTLGFDQAQRRKAWQVQIPLESLGEIKTEFRFDTLENIFWRHYTPEPLIP